MEITVPDQEIIKRMSGRRVHKASGRTYHVLYNPPKNEGRDDLTGEPLIQRDDDQEDTVKERLQVYRDQTQPLIGFYSGRADGDKLRYVTVNGLGNVEEIQKQIIDLLRN